jgi:hypothetical protein
VPDLLSTAEKLNAEVKKLVGKKYLSWNRANGSATWFLPARTLSSSSRSRSFAVNLYECLFWKLGKPRKPEFSELFIVCSWKEAQFTENWSRVTSERKRVKNDVGFIVFWKN